MYNMTNKYGNSHKSQYVMKSKSSTSPSPQGIPTYIGRGISFGKLSRVPTCTIQDGKKLYMPNAMVFKI